MAKENILRTQVETMLREVPETRNCDILLTIQIWQRYYPEMIKTTKKGSKGIYLDSLFTLPREDNVKRHRARIQNEEHKYLPTIWEVARRRRINEDRWRETLGYAPKN